MVALPRHIQKVAPEFGIGEIPVSWGPVKVKAEWTADHPLKRASGVFLLTNQRLWYLGTVMKSGVPLDRVEFKEYVERGLTGYINLRMDAGSTYCFYEAKRTMRPLAVALGLRA